MEVNGEMAIGYCAPLWVNTCVTEDVAVEIVIVAVREVVFGLAVNVNPTAESPMPPALFGVSQDALLVTAQAVFEVVVVTEKAGFNEPAELLLDVEVVG